MTFGEKLRAEREKKGLTQTEVGEFLGLVQSTIAKYELGIKKPTVDVLVALAKFYGVSMDYLTAEGV